MPYTNKLITHCKAIFGRCDIFQNQDHLRAFFLGDLDIYKAEVPDNAKNSKERMELCVDFLLELPHSEDGKPAIIIFILNLITHYSEEESGIKNQLEELITDFSKEAENSIQRFTKEKQRLERQEDDDFQQAKQELQHSDSSINIEEWFKSSNISISEKSFKIALAVLNGAKYSSVIDAAGSLLKLLAKNFNDPSSVYEFDPFTHGRNNRLEYSEIKDKTNTYGERISSIQYKDPSYPISILDFIWKEYDDTTFREPFIKWLTTLAIDGQVDIRNRVALTVGILAQLDFPDVRDKILYAWALKNDRFYRSAIGKVLGVAIENETIGYEVIQTLGNWGNSKNESLVWATTRAYSNVGIRYPQEAFEQWEKILNSTDRLINSKITPTLHLSLVNPLHMSLVDSMLSLLLTAPDSERFLNVYHVALQQLLVLSKTEPIWSKTNLGLSLFVISMNTFVRVSNKSTTSDLDSFIEIPAMVKLVNINDKNAYRQNMCELLYFSLNHLSTRIPATEAIHNWFLGANNTIYSNNLITIIKDLFSFSKNNKEVVGERLKLFLKEWGKSLPLAHKAIDIENLQ
jgi:hypothetical protein